MRNVVRQPPRSAPSEVIGGEYRPVKDDYLSRMLGVRVNVFNRTQGHMARGYADPWSDEKSVSLSTPEFESLRSLELLGRGIPNTRTAPKIDGHMAHAAYVLAHELGHVFASKHDNEDSANTWAANHMMLYLKRMGVSQPQRRLVFQLAQRQGLV